MPSKSEFVSTIRKRTNRPNLRLLVGMNGSAVVFEKELERELGIMTLQALCNYLFYEGVGIGHEKIIVQLEFFAMLQLTDQGEPLTNAPNRTTLKSKPVSHITQGRTYHTDHHDSHD